MKIIKRLMSGALALVFAAVMLTGTGCSAKENITVKIDGNTVDFDVSPQAVDGRTLVPMRKIFEELGALVKWDGDTQTVSARKSSKTVTLTLNSSEMTVDKGDTDSDGNAVTETVALEVPAQAVSGRTLVPVRVVSEAFGCDVSWDDKSRTVEITTSSESDDSWKENKVEINLTKKTVSGSGAEFDGDRLNITAGGDYTITGVLNGSVNVDTEERIKLRLSGVSITSDGEPCIYVENADKAFITAEDGTSNTLTAKNYDKGTVYSKDNLEFKGDGELKIVSENGDGIKASDNLTIESGSITVSAYSDGIHVNDTFKAEGGTLDITAGNDGIDSESIVIINGGEIKIKTTLEPSNKDELDEKSGNSFRMPEESASAEFEASSKGIKADWMMVVNGGDIDIDSTDHSVHCLSDIEINGGNFSLSSEYAKGISGHGNVTVDGDKTVIDIKKCTEGIESKNVVTVNNGKISVVSSDDSINGGGTQGMQMGAPEGNGDRDGNRPQRHDGESGFENRDNGTGAENGRGFGGDRRPPQNGDGEIQPGAAEPPSGENGRQPFGGDMQPSQDGNEPPEFGGNPGGDMPSGIGGGKNLKDVVVINGGELELTAGDDCLDANGNLVINGGIIKATKTNGTVSGFEAVLDADGTVGIGENATLICAVGRGSAPNIDISQYEVTVYTDETHGEGDKITLKDSSGKVISEYTAGGSFGVVWIASPSLKKGKTYTVCIGDETHTFTTDSQSTTVGTASGFSEIKRQ